MGQRAGRREHHLRRQQHVIEPCFEQKLLMPQTPWRTPSFEQDPTTFLLKRGDALNRKYQGLFIQKQRIGMDRLDDPIDIDALFQLYIDIALSCSVGSTLLGAEGFLHSSNRLRHRRMVETHADAMCGVGVALWSQECEQGPKQGQRPRIPPGTHNGRDFVANGYAVNRLAMRMKGLSMKHGRFHDRDTMLKTLVCRIKDLRQRYAQQSPLHILHRRQMGHDRNLAERLRQGVSQTVRASNDRRQDKVLPLKQDFRTDLADPPKTHYSKT